MLNLPCSGDHFGGVFESFRKFKMAATTEHSFKIELNGK
jgi:hypothetical protein